MNVRLEPFDPIGILERDKWICQICKRPTPTRLRGTTHAMAPEIDHIIALANGAVSTPENTHCVCRECNSIKGTGTIVAVRESLLERYAGVDVSRLSIDDLRRYRNVLHELGLTPAGRVWQMLSDAP